MDTVNYATDFGRSYKKAKGKGKFCSLHPTLFEVSSRLNLYWTLQPAALQWWLT